MAATAAPAKAPQYFTTKAQASAKVGKGQVVRFATGKGYYAGAPLPAPLGEYDGYTTQDLSSFGLTPAQLRAMVGQTVSGELAPQESALKSMQALTDKQYAERLASVNELSQQYADLLKSIAPNVQANYDTAANALAAYGKGFSGIVQNQLNQGGQQGAGMLAVAGAPSAQSAAAASHLTAPVDALYAKAALPAGALQNAGAAFGAQASELPAMALGRGQEEDRTLLGAQGAADLTLQQKLENLIGTIPSLRTNAENSILKNARADLASNLLLQKYGLTAANTRSEITHRQHADTLASQRLTLAQQQAHEKSVGKRDTALRSADNYLNRWLQKTMSTGTTAAASGGLPAKTRTQSLGQGLSKEQYWAKGPNGYYWSNNPNDPNVVRKSSTSKSSAPFNYGKARRYIVSYLRGALSGFGYTPDDFLNMADALLSQNGAKPPAPPAPAPIVLHRSHTRVP